MKIGTLARRAGLTVRTLHHYDEIGLLVPSERTEGGHRHYTPEDVARLQQILSLRALGWELQEIRSYLDGPEVDPAGIVERHLARVRAQGAALRRLEDRLAWLVRALRANEGITTDELTDAILEMTMIEKHYTDEQLDTLRARREALGEDGMRRAEADWAELIAAVRAEMERGTDPAAHEVQALARRWKALVEAFTGGDPGIARSLGNMYRAEGPERASRGMLDPDVFAYAGRALAALDEG